MALLFAEDKHPTQGRLIGFDRYRQLLERDHIAYLLGGFVTLLGLAPFAAGMAYAALSSSALVMLAAAVVGGAIAGPFLYALHDLLFRSLRDASDNWWRDYKAALRSGAKQAVLPGIVFCLFWGTAIFMGLLLFWWRVSRPGLDTVVIYLVSMLVSLMLLATYWPQLVLFEQSNALRLHNCLLFCIKYFWHTLGAAALQLCFAAVMLLFAPWTLIAVPILGVWFVLFLSDFFLYRDLDAAYHIEEEINRRFPGQILSDD